MQSVVKIPCTPGNPAFLPRSLIGANAICIPDYESIGTDIHAAAINGHSLHPAVWPYKCADIYRCPDELTVHLSTDVSCFLGRALALSGKDPKPVAV